MSTSKFKESKRRWPQICADKTQIKMKQEIAELTEKEQQWTVLQLQAASGFVEKFSPQDRGTQVTLAALDRAFAAWITTHPTDADVINETINGIGIYFGQALVDGLGMKWVIVSDDLGTDLAVLGLPGRGDVLVFPANFVAKRWERREINFLEDSYRRIKDQMNAIARSWGDFRS
jgi:hypothetical protein